MSDKEYLEYNLIQEKKKSSFYLMRLRQIKGILNNPDISLDQIKSIVNEAVMQAETIQDDDYYDGYTIDEFYGEIPALEENSTDYIEIDKVSTSKPITR